MNFITQHEFLSKATKKDIVLACFKQAVRELGFLFCWSWKSYQIEEDLILALIVLFKDGEETRGLRISVYKGWRVHVFDYSRIGKFRPTHSKEVTHPEELRDFFKEFIG